MIGVSHNRVKPAGGQQLLPPALGFRIMQSPGRITKAALARADHVIVVVPHRVPASAWQNIPGLKSLQAVHRRLGKEGAGRALRGALGSNTAVTLGALPAPAKGGAKTSLPTPFELLKFGGELAGDALKDEPRSIGIVASGFSKEDADRVTTALLLALGAHSWKSQVFQKKPPKTPKGSSLRTVTILGLPERIDTTRAEAEIDGANLVRWLTALPANKLSATTYRAVLTALATKHDWEFEWLGEAELRKLNAGAFLAVAQGNAAPEAGIARLRYRPDKLGKKSGGKGPAAADVALVGKGIIFDTGGTNLKSAPHMLDMHTDMCGSAVALAVLQTLSTLKSPLKVDCWLAITENRTGSDSLQAAGCRHRQQWRNHRDHAHRRRGSHGSGRHAGTGRAGKTGSHARLRHTDGRLRLRPVRAL